MKLIGSILLLMSLLLVSCTSSISEEKSCQSDLDCVPASCCHATDAINIQFAPDCQSKICTFECAPNSIDCGQGGVACMDGVCKVVLYDQ